MLNNMMTNIHIDIKNCYGIGELKHDITFKPGQNCCVIYAPNGTMKTSFANTVKDLANGFVPKDMVFYERESSSVIQLDGKNVSIDNCYVYDNGKINGGKSITSFLANKKLKEQYDQILEKLNECWGDLRRKIASDSRSTDCEKELLKVFSPRTELSIFECLHHIYFQYFKNKKSDLYPLFSFKYNDIFDKEGKVERFVSENMNNIKKYFNQYQKVIRNSALFSDGRDSFGTYQANKLLKSVEDDKFFKASHKIVLRNGRQIKNTKAFKTMFDEEIERVFTDTKLKNVFDSIEKKIDANVDLRKFKEVIHQYPSLVLELMDYDGFRKKVLLGYLSNNMIEFIRMVDLYQSEKSKIRRIISEANKGIEKWNCIIKRFNNRFYVPFEVYIENQSDMILKEETAYLGFRYKESEGNGRKESQDTLLHILSTGESRAFHILQNLFEIEARKESGKDTLLVLDDIADSFDYKNKYAIVEYLADLMGSDKFALIILTHNFDFYRTVISRLCVNNVFLAEKSDNRQIILNKGFYNTDLLKRKFIQNIANVRSFIGLIPFVRNLIEYSQGGKSDDYILLTSCLHIKRLPIATDSISMSCIFDVYKRNLYGVSNKTIIFSSENYLEMLFNEAEAILSDDDEVNLSNKLIISIAIRLKTEQLLFNILTESQVSEIKANRNQTGELVQIFKKYYGETNFDVCCLLDRVVMFTSENIHVNNFMFEPIVDISIYHLKQLYKDVVDKLKIYEV